MDIPKDKSKIKELVIDTFKRPRLGDTEVNSLSSSTVFGASNVEAATEINIMNKTADIVTSPF